MSATLPHEVLEAVHSTTHWACPTSPKPVLQVVLVSATLPHEVLEMTHKFMTDPVRILVKRDELTLEVGRPPVPAGCPGAGGWGTEVWGWAESGLRPGEEVSSAGAQP